MILLSWLTETAPLSVQSGQLKLGAIFTQGVTNVMAVAADTCWAGTRT